MDTSAATPTLSRSSRIAVALAIGTAALFGAACSSAAEVTPTTATSDQPAQVESTTAETSSADTDTAPVAETASEYGDLDCQALHEARVGIQGTGGNLIYAEDADFVDLLIGSADALAELRADIETLRPFQDVDAVPFGPIREGLDNFENDLTAATEGRFEDIIGGYKPAGINGLMAELGC